MQPTIFISYSHVDEEWKDRLIRQLNVLASEEHFKVWDDRRIAAGDDWYPEIEAAVNTASVAILLISEDFLTSSFIPPHSLYKKSQSLISDTHSG